MTAFSSKPWGWLAWGLSWSTQSVLFNHSNYYSNSTPVADWGFPYGGLRAASAMARLPNSFNRQPDSYGWLSSASNGTRAQAYVHQPPNSYGRPGGGYSVTPGQRFAPRPPDSYAGSRPGEGSSRGYQTPGVGYARPPLEAHNRIQPQVSTPQLPAYRAPTARVQRGDFGQRSTGALVGRGFAGSSS